MSRNNTLPNAAYTVALICALPQEFAAATAILDENHGTPVARSPQDSNIYELGRIGTNKVVITVLPQGEYGTASSASVVRNLQTSFPNIQFGILVGIGGGVPSERHDIRLGDVAIGLHIVQYDFGKGFPDSFTQHAFTAHPLEFPPQVEGAIAKIKTENSQTSQRLQQSIHSALEAHPRLSAFKKPDASTDKLYRASHTKETDPQHGDGPFEIERLPRVGLNNGPMIHYGAIASGNSIMKDAAVRDKIAAEGDIICFEMEAAGVTERLPSLVVRGICDYSDSHKSKKWQNYAAMTAAAYAKELLRITTFEGNVAIADNLLAVASTDPFDDKEPESGTVPRVRFEAPIQDHVDSVQEDDERWEKDSDSSSDRDSDISVDRASTAPTEAEIDVTNIGDIVRTFLDLIFENRDSLEAIRLSLGRKSEYLLGKQIRLLLKQFIAGLRTESDISDKDMVSLFSGRSMTISRKIVEEVRSSLEMTLTTSNMATHDATSATKDEDEEADLEAEGGDDATDGEEDNILTAEIDVLGFHQFISSSTAFQLFLDDIYHLAFPSFKKSLKTLLKRWRRKNLGIQFEKIISELLYSQPKTITVTEVQPAWSDRIKELVETSTGEPWSWWPLRPKVAPLQQGQVRIAWLCKCGDMRSEVVPREVGLALRKMSLKVAASSPKPTNNSGPSVPEQIHLRPLSGSSTYPTANVPALPHQGSSRRTTGPNLRNRRAYAAQTQEVDLDSRAVYFMVDNSSLFPWKAGLQRSLIPSTNLCDEVFYGKMRREYWKHRGWWRQWFSLYTFVGCDFYQFKRYRAGRFRENQPGLPDQANDKYEYDDEDPPPQVSWEEFKDGYWYSNTNCVSASECTGMDALRRIPRKIVKTADDGKHDVFWGIVARQQKSFAMVLIYTTIAGLPILPSIWFFFWWLNPGELTDEVQRANRQDNLSNAFIPLGIAIALQMGVLTCVR